MSYPEFQSAKHEISPQELENKLNQNQPLVLIDVREPSEYELVHIEDAILIPLNDLPQKINQFDPANEIVTYCHHGTRSLHAAAFLHKNGFRNVKSLAGGIDSWATEIDSTLGRY